MNKLKVYGIPFKKLGLATFRGGGLLLLGGCYFRGGGVTTFRGLLLLGFTSGHKKLTLISGGHYFQANVTIRTLQYHKLATVNSFKADVSRFSPSSEPLTKG